ncbi:MAG: hypothetical protein KKD44_08610 [Proteobacteria bacterium]|nr:hypothetical protein [Pseudomonadota bacterium]
MTMALFFVFATLAAITLIQLWDSRAEYASPLLGPARFSSWCIHHDEKIMISDCRYYYLRHHADMGIDDYKPYPVSAAFGLAGPLLAAMGFRLFGFNNVGLRVFFILMAGVTNLFCILSFQTLAPGIVGACIGMIYLLSYCNFLLTRHAILENVMTFLLCSILFLYIHYPLFLSENLFWFAFFTGVSLLFKPNYALYGYMLFFVMALIDPVGRSGLPGMFLGAMAGILFFEGGQLVILYRMGIVRWRYFNLLSAFKQQSGRNVDLLQKFTPSGWSVFPEYLIHFAEWFFFPWGGKRLYHRRVLLVVSFVVTLATSFSLVMGMHRAGHVIIVFTLVYLILSATMFFFLKRAVSLFPLLMMLVCLVCRSISDAFLFLFPNGGIVILIVCLVSVFFYAASQYRVVRRFKACRSHGVEKNSQALDGDIPEGSEVYAHCYAYRFFWQVRRQRLFSCADDSMDNQMILEWALKEDAKYLLFSSRGGNIDFSKTDFFGIIRLVKTYENSDIESDVVDEYALFEITNLEIGGMITDVPGLKSECQDLAHVITQLNWISESWLFCKRTGLTLGFLELDLSLLKRLMDCSDCFSGTTARVLADVYHVLTREDVHAPTLNVFGEDLLFYLAEREGLLDRATEMIEKGDYHLLCPDWYCTIGDYYADSDIIKATAWYQRYLREAGQNSPEREDTTVFQENMRKVYVRASELKSSGQHRLAQEVFLLLEKKGFQRWGVYFHLGEMALSDGDHDKAKLCFKKCLKHKPQHKKARQYLSEYNH